MFIIQEKIIERFRNFIRKIIGEEVEKFQISDSMQELVNQRNSVYAERDMVIALAAKLALRSPSCVAELWQHPDSEEWEDEWRWIVAIKLPQGWVSWHIHKSEKLLFDSLPICSNKWDGHDQAEKYRRLKNFVMKNDQ